MPFSSIDLDHLAHTALALWDLPRGATAHLINVAENKTYLVTAPCGYKAVLRLHRAGYHSQQAIASELMWLEALGRDTNIPTPNVIVGRDHRPIQRVTLDSESTPHYMVMFDHISGHAPDETQDIRPGFETLGRLAAACHQHVTSWEKPVGFTRFSWDTDAVFGPHAPWGNWRDAPGVSTTNQSVLEAIEETIIHRLGRYGQASDRYNLIHADMRLANLLVDGPTTRLIDFDDCGYGWFMYDFAAAISFMEDDPRVPAFKAAWLKGYEAVRALTPDDSAEMDTFIMLRRMALLAWIGSHMDAPEPQRHAPDFAETTARLGRQWLNGMS